MQTASGNINKKTAVRYAALILAFCSLAAVAVRLSLPKDKPADNSKPTPLYVSVESDEGLVMGLGKDNFRLFVDGKPRSFILGKPEKSAAIALLMEYSQSSGIYFEDIRAAMADFLDVTEEGYWYSLSTFSDKTHIEVDFTKQRGKISAAFSDLSQPLWDEINTYDAVYSMLDKLGRLKHRSILVVLGSGLDTFSKHTLEDVQKKVESVNVVIYCIGAGSSLRGEYEPYLNASDRMDLLQAESFLRMLADKSGGEAWFPKVEGAIPDIMHGIMQTIDHRYCLVYQASMPGPKEFRKIKVEAFGRLKGEERTFKVKVREGWRRPYYR